MQIRADQLAAHLQARPAPRLHRLGRRAAAGAGGRRRDPRRRARRRLQRAPGAHRRRRALRLEQPARRVAGAEPVRRPAADRDPHPLGQARQGRLRGAAALLRGAIAGDGRRRHAGAAAAARPHAADERLVRRARSRRRDDRASIRSSARRCRSGSRSAWRRRASASPAGDDGQQHARLLRRPGRGQPARRAPGDRRSSACSIRRAS